MRVILATAVCLAFSGAAAMAQTQAPPPSSSFWSGWTGEGALGAGITTGNTENIDVGIGVKLAKEFDPWKVSLEGGYDFARQTVDINTDAEDSVTTVNRWYLGGQAQRNFTDRLYGFGNIRYEEDDFSGFDSRLFVGVGAGYHVFKEKPLTWSLEVAPGYRRSVIADVVEPGVDAVIDPGPPEVIIVPAIPETIITPGFTANDFAIRGSSRFLYDFNDYVTFTNDTDVIWTNTSTQTINTAALTAKLSDKLSGRVSFEVRNDTNPPDGFVSTDTATRVSVVYGF